MAAGLITPLLRPVLEHQRKRGGVIIKDWQSYLIISTWFCGLIHVTFVSKPDVRVDNRRGGLCCWLVCLSTCIFISRRSRNVHSCAEKHIMALLWDKERAKVTVNVKTGLPLKRHRSPFTPTTKDKSTLYFSSYKPLDDTLGSQRHQQSEEAPPEL